jgi:glycine dehydrogenase
MTRPTLAELDDDGRFATRHIGPRESDRLAMLATLGFDDADELLDALVPSNIRLERELDLPAARSEQAALDVIRGHATRNRVTTSLIGMGYSDTLTPGVILRNVLEDPAWYTAYTPYQPEISQGRLEALLNFQTMVSDLTGMEIANASMLDEGTAAAEAMTMARRSTKHSASAFFVDRDCHPQTIDVVVTRAEPLGIEVLLGDPTADLDPTAVFGALLAYPGSSGEIRDLSTITTALHDAGAFVAVTSDLLALCLLTPPGEWGADAVVGSAQRFGVPMGFGGPHAGFLATREADKRALPGRLVGLSVDAAGRPALRLALQTREQHIRREKATSNICTAQVLLAVIASMYGVYHGADGLRRIATRTQRLTAALAQGLRAAGVEVPTRSHFDTITVSVPGRARDVLAAALDRDVNLRIVDDDTLGISLDETSTPALVATVLDAFGVTGADVAALDEAAADPTPAGLVRTSEYLTHDVFRRHRSETDLLRYLRTLSDRDLALDRSMIPLGSCTMKLNATSEMIPVTWPEFGSIHPFAPLDQVQGYLALFDELEAWLAEITGYDRVSLQPNAGSQGEYAGLLAIRAYHRSRRDHARDVCLIPASAHGTNAASAVMAGMRVVVVACDEAGNVDLRDLHDKAIEHAGDLAALMVTYPSTHGVFEESIRDICDEIHGHGGQVYLDGANMNALVGVARPGDFGADVGHLNLHKTFCIPHGGGGPGVGPVGVKAHLAPFLPNHPLVGPAGPDTGVGAISAAPWGSASILPISWMYLAMMGPDGLRDATAGAILAANYVARRLDGHYPVLYSGRGGLVAHECILDIRPLEKSTGIGAEDIAKRLIDYGFHAPTMSFPVAGTLMVEPTESEPLVELDRFCDAMLAIRDEIRRVESGEWTADESPLRHAPHTADDLLEDEWKRAYPRSLAAYPLPSLRRTKYWAPVGRVDNGFGDRNLMCSCPPIEAFV